MLIWRNLEINTIFFVVNHAKDSVGFDEIEKLPLLGAEKNSGDSPKTAKPPRMRQKKHSGGSPIIANHHYGSRSLLYIIDVDRLMEVIRVVVKPLSWAADEK
ncbi:hypothetical protein [Kallipyga massiliensis]|uniref:hypothetical protein n=1 Tax=Kallipyga massiliensis TaxID=1472764 RepID=UPI0026EBEAC1|nr:hypothetical protein [Kallipyga massiliensis]